MVRFERKEILITTMKTIHITGQQQLQGTIQTMGAKNEALKTVAASVLFDDTVTITNVPDIQDIHVLLNLLQEMGATTSYSKETHTATILPKLTTTVIPSSFATKIRASVVLLGPMLAKYQSVTLPAPGGDTIGKRPIDFFITAFKQMGATVDEKDGAYHFSAAPLKSADVILPTISVTATEAIMMAATLTSGTTTIHNCAVEPEIVSLAEKLKSTGANITGEGTHNLQITGVDKLQFDQPWKTIPDRIEAGTFTALAVATNSDITITDCNTEHLQVPLNHFRSLGATIETTETTIHVTPTSPPLKAATLKTHEYPGFSTDLQSQLAIVYTQCEGMSFIHETIFEGRLHYLETLKQFGADTILFDPHRAAIIGPTALRGTVVRSPDIRAGIAFIIAGLVASGETEIQNIYQIQRGAERIVERLQDIGAKITLQG